MGYYTTIKVVNSEGRAIKAHVSVGGKYEGFSDERTGEFSFEAEYAIDLRYTVSRYGASTSGVVRGGTAISERLS
jgi:hypothetical protein